MSDTTEKYLNIVIVNMFMEVKEREKSMLAVLHQIENINKEIVIIF